MTQVEKMNLALCNGGASELLMLLYGLSELNEKDFIVEEKQYNPEDYNNPQHTRSLAMEHIHFIEKFGCHGFDSVEKEGRFHFAYQKEFDNWVKEGISGLSALEVERFLTKFLPANSSGSVVI